MAAARSPARRGFLRVRRELTARLAASRWQHEGGSERGQPYCCWRMQALAVELSPGFSWFLGTKNKEDGWNSSWDCVYARHSKPGLSPQEDPREALGHGSPRLLPAAGPSLLCPPSAKALSPLGTAWGLFFGAHGPCPCVGMVSEPCNTAVCSQQSSGVALTLPASSRHPMVLSWGTFLGSVIFQKGSNLQGLGNV